MSFVLVNQTATAVVLNDLGLTVPASGTLDITDMSPAEISMSATGGDLETAINAGDILVEEPRDGYPGPNLNLADSLTAARASNDAHIGIRLANISDMDDVDTSGASSTDVLQLNGSGIYVPVAPSVLAGDIAFGDLSDVDDGAAHTANAPVILMGDGTNYDTVSLVGGTSITGVAVAGTSLTFNVDDDFISNQGGDTFGDVTFGTWTVASGSNITIAAGADLIITDAPVNPTDAANKEYVDSVAAGLDPKESVRYCTVLDVSGTYATAGGTGGTGAFTTVDFTSSAIFDGLTVGAIAIGDRILVKSQTEVSGFADAAISGSPAGSTVSLLAASTYDFDVTIDGGALQQLSITTTASSDYDAIAALMNTAVSGGSVAFVSGAFRVTSATTGNTSTVVVAAGTAGSGGGDLFTAIDTADTVTTTFPTPTEGTASTQNGIYSVTDASASGAMERAADQNGSPTNEVSGGNFTFVENGTTCASTGWVLQGDGVLTLNTDPMSWVQFSESSDFSAGDGLALTGSVFSMDINNMTAAPIALGDEIAFNDVSGPDVPRNTTVQSMLDGLNIPYGLTGTGIVVQTADDTYIKRAIAVDGVGALDGLAIANADGTGGDPTVGLDVQGLPLLGEAIDQANDMIIMWNPSTGANERVSVSSIVNAGAAPGYGVIVGDGPSSATATTVSESITFSGDGIVVTAADGTPDTVDFVLDISDLTPIGVGVIILADTFAIDDGSATNKEATFADLVNDLQIPNAIGATAGFVTSNGGGAYTTVTIAANGTEDLVGINVTPTDGSTNTLIGLDIVGLTNPVEDMAATDEFAIHNKSQGTLGANRKITGQEIADGVSTILNLPAGLTVTTIGGQEVLTLIDTTRTDKVLSVETTAVTWSENRIGNNDWVQIGGANDALIGYVVPLNATIVKVTAHTTSANTTAVKTIDLYVDDVLNSTIATLPLDAGGLQTRYLSVVDNIDINANQKIQLRGGSTGGVIQDTVITIWLKWRG